MHPPGYHGHTHVPTSHGRAFAIGVVLNSVFVVVELVYGIMADSMALIADAGHNLSDVLSLLLAWGAAKLATRPASERFTYGYKSSTIIAAIANAMLLLVALGMILMETIERFSDPQPVQAGTVMIVAGIGIVINTATALMFMRGGKDDLNIRGAFLHMAADALVSLGVVISGALIWWTGALWLDPVTSLIIVALIGATTWGLLKDSVKLGLNAVPDHINIAKVRDFLETQPGVTTVHDLHIWPMSTTEAALTAHLIMPEGHPGDCFLFNLAVELKRDYNIEHSTFQVELKPHEAGEEGVGCDGCC